MPAAMADPNIPQTWDIFCRVIDNFGDAGVCWRLARLLRHEHGLDVRLWIDSPRTLQALHPALDPHSARQTCDGISVCSWPEAGLPEKPAAVVVEAFGCGLPGEWVARMAHAQPPPLWIVLEYLSAEPWVDSHHGLSSPHPQLSLPRYFFFPGFTAASGGLLREADLLARRDAFDAAARAGFWRQSGFRDGGALTLSLFAYADAPLGSLLGALAAGAEPTVVALPEGVLWPAARAFFGVDSLAAGQSLRRGALELRLLPFLPQARYDELLWACDLNFVRGEDSFVRAQWAARPLVWQPYRQDDGAHLRKLEAFLVRHGAGLNSAALTAYRDFMARWNGAEAAEFRAAWPALRACLDELAGHARAWAAHLSTQGELAAKLADFARSRVK
ncbi:MAG: elongation factor P maturation arginine rhamnosyltransferase EarP [Burkholderiales bacterium]|nr:elongation factor P maturation arginine rhamnosyltransferase EarP [Burkholderiales bacterium]